MELDPNAGAWNVIRSEFDEILLNHATESGASVYQEHKVTKLNFQPDEGFRPTSAEYQGPHGRTGTICFDYLVDASGRQGIMSTRYLKNRRMNSSLKNIAYWGYWKGGKIYQPGTSRHNAPWFEALMDESGWSWYIPMHDATVSVGFVMNMDSSTKKKREGGPTRGLKEHYLDQLKFSPGLKELLSEAVLVEDGSKPGVQSASDFSYSATNYAGSRYRLVGDASGELPLIQSPLYLQTKLSFHRSILQLWASRYVTVMIAQHANS